MIELTTSCCQGKEKKNRRYHQQKHEQQHQQTLTARTCEVLTTNNNEQQTTNQATNNKGRRHHHHYNNNKQKVSQQPINQQLGHESHGAPNLSPNVRRSKAGTEVPLAHRRRDASRYSAPTRRLHPPTRECPVASVPLQRWGHHWQMIRAKE